MGLGALGRNGPWGLKLQGVSEVCWGSPWEVKVGVPGRAAGESLRGEGPLGSLLHPLPAVQVTRENREW